MGSCSGLHSRIHIYFLNNTIRGTIMRKSINLRSVHALDMDTLKEAIPSAFTTSAWSGMSPKYRHLTTEPILQALLAEGLGVYAAKQSGTRTEGKEHHTLHEIRLRVAGVRNHQAPAVVGECVPEIIVRNSSVGNALTIEAGLYRFVCSNGLTVSMGSFAYSRRLHTGNVTINHVLESVYGIMANFPHIIETVEKMKSRKLEIEERARFAELALGLRFDIDKKPYEASRLLELRRAADENVTVFGAFNVIQENLTQGQTSRGGFFRGERGTRRIASIQFDSMVNRGLWQLAQSFV